ncbi:MAG: glycosyltransferase [Verrucomicrobiota bacterium]
MSRRKVLLIAPPFSGHLHPLLGIGEALREIADVKVLSSPSAARVCALPFHPILAQHEHTVWAIAEPGKDVKSNPLLLYRQLKANIALLRDLKTELETLFRSEKPDLIIADFTIPLAGIVAGEMGLEWWTTVPSPCVFETPDGPPSYFGGLGPAKTAMERLQHTFLRQTTRAFKRSMHLLFRRELRAIGFPSIYRRDGSEAVYSPHRIFGLGIPEIEFPRTYPRQFQFTGPVLYTPPEDVPEPAFAIDGRPQILITLGTHLPHAKAGMAKVMREIAARHPEMMFHFTHGSARGDLGPPTENFHEYRHVSYVQHVSKYDLVIHHAGTGILNHCLRHGKPAVVLPQDYDQFDYATRLVEHGLALRARGHVDLESVLLQALADSALKMRCQALSVIHSQQDGARHISGLVAAMG